jgi:hypothetical protein
MGQKLKLFYSYAHRDFEWYRKVRVHLNPLVQDSLIEEWSDQDLRAGEWSEEILNQLDSADIILLLVTAEYISSDNCKKEYSRAMERHESLKKEGAICNSNLVNARRLRTRAVWKVAAVPGGLSTSKRFARLR